MAPLAPISAVTAAELPGVIEAVGRRLRGRATSAGDLWVAGEGLMGLRYPEALGARLLGVFRGWEESGTYQAIVRKGVGKGRAEGKAEGRIEEARKLLRLLGEQRYGPPDARSRKALDAVNDRER